MAILSPTGDPSDDKKLWWRCVFIAVAVQAVLILFRLTSFRNILLCLFIWFATLITERFEVGDPFSLIPIFWILLPVCIVLNSLVLGTVFYFVCWLKEKDF